MNAGATDELLDAVEVVGEAGDGAEQATSATPNNPSASRTHTRLNMFSLPQEISTLFVEKSILLRRAMR